MSWINENGVFDGEECCVILKTPFTKTILKFYKTPQIKAFPINPFIKNAFSK
jgi:hypothetical protein